jgi:uncharacterized protein DUF4340
MEKRTLYALLAVLGLGAIAFAVLRAPEKGQRQGPPPRPIAVLKAADITELEVFNEKQAHSVLAKSGAEWELKDPGPFKADQAGVKQLLDSLEKLAFSDTASENPEKQAELGVADGKSARIVAKGAGGKVLADLLVGKATNGFTMLRLAGKTEVWQATGLYPYVIARDSKGWRDHAIFDFPMADVEKLTVVAGGDKLALEKTPAAKDKPNDIQWKVAEAAGSAPKTVETLDVTQATQAAQGLSNLHASDFVDDKKRDDDFQKSARIVVTVTAKGKAHTLWVGAEKGDDVTVASSDSPTIFLVKKYSLDRVGRKPIDYRDKALTKVKEADLASLELTSGSDTTTLTQGKDGKWTAAKGTADDTKIKPVVSAFENLQADGYSDEKEPAKTGLAKPTGQAVLHLKNKQTVTLKVGVATKDGDYYLQKVGSPDIYRVKKFAVDRWMKKSADLTKK